MPYHTSKTEIIDDIRKQFSLLFRDKKLFFITVTNDHNELFTKYKIKESLPTTPPKEKDVYMYRTAETHEDALLIRKFFVDMGLKTNKKRIPKDAKIVIAYKLKQKTKK